MFRKDTFGTTEVTVSTPDDNDGNPLNDYGVANGVGNGGGGGSVPAGSISRGFTPSYYDSSAYNTYTIRTYTAGYDGMLGGYHTSSPTHGMSNFAYYNVPGAVTVTDDMVIPQHAKEVAKYVRSHNNSPPKGYKGRRTFHNDGRQNSQILPSSFGPYRKYDVHPYVKGKSRGGERIVIGIHGPTYYTRDHYRTFVVISED